MPAKVKRTVKVLSRRSRAANSNFAGSLLCHRSNILRGMCPDYQNHPLAQLYQSNPCR